MMRSSNCEDLPPKESRPTRTDTRGIRALRGAYPQLKIAKGLVIAPTESLLQLSEDEYALPWDTA